MELIDVLAQAMKLESDGQEFYTKMVDVVADADGKAMFKQLAADEVDHYNYIKRQYEALQAGKGWTAIPEQDLVESIDAVSLIFPSGKEAVADLSDNPTEEQAMLFALGVEDKSFQLYYNSAQSAKDSEAKKLFLQLASAEQTHFNILMHRYEARFAYPR